MTFKELSEQIQRLVNVLPVEKQNWSISICIEDDEMNNFALIVDDNDKTIQILGFDIVDNEIAYECEEELNEGTLEILSIVNNEIVTLKFNEEEELEWTKKQ